MIERIGRDVERELGRFGPVSGMAEIVTAWPAAVGEAIARNAWPARLARDGTLHVAVSSSPWAFELTQLAGRVLERLHDELGDHAPPRLRFAPGPLPEARPPAEASKTPVRPTPEQVELASSIVASIDDDELRRTVAQAAAASLARTASDR